MDNLDKILAWIEENEDTVETEHMAYYAVPAKRLKEFIMRLKDEEEYPPVPKYKCNCGQIGCPDCETGR